MKTTDHPRFRSLTLSDVGVAYVVDVTVLSAQRFHVAVYRGDVEASARGHWQSANAAIIGQAFGRVIAVHGDAVTVELERLGTTAELQAFAESVATITLCNARAAARAVGGKQVTA